MVLHEVEAVAGADEANDEGEGDDVSSDDDVSDDDVGDDDDASGTWTDVAVGGYEVEYVDYGHSCGLRGDGTVECWGNNDHWQAAPPSGAFTQIEAIDKHSCGLKTDGKMACWGYPNSVLDDIPTTAFQSFDTGGQHIGHVVSVQIVDQDGAETAPEVVRGFGEALEREGGLPQDVISLDRTREQS